MRVLVVEDSRTLADALVEGLQDEAMAVVDPFTNTVHVTLSRLRRKLGEPAAIETVPGVGYRVAEPSA
jgi:DNA-binding response OmpR family regulator